MHDKYALFVWPAYAVTAIAFAWMVVDTLVRVSAWRRRVDRLEAAPKPAPESAPETGPRR
jgi:heme exporter protein D